MSASRSRSRPFTNSVPKENLLRPGAVFYDKNNSIQRPILSFIPKRPRASNISAIGKILGRQYVYLPNGPLGAGHYNSFALQQNIFTPSPNTPKSSKNNNNQRNNNSLSYFSTPTSSFSTPNSSFSTPNSSFGLQNNPIYESRYNNPLYENKSQTKTRRQLQIAKPKNNNKNKNNNNNSGPLMALNNL
eukprot:1194161-Prorocentrum_minimum.AAC.1